MAITLLGQSFLWGVASAISLPIGALIAFFAPISKKWNCALLAFGSGALLFAVTIEIYGKTIYEYDEMHDGNKIPMVLLAIGSLMGSFIFSVSNYMIENQGGFLRKFALKTNYITRLVRKRESVRRESLRSSSRGPLTRPARPYGSIRESDSEHSPMFADYKKLKPEESDLIKETSSTKTLNDDSRRGSEQSQQSADFAIDDGKFKHGDDDPSHPHLFRLPTVDDLEVTSEVQAAVEAEFMENKSDAHVGIAIWLGILIDSFPESLVIGILVGEGISYTFIAGVFISNLPEALSSTVIMRRGGLSKLRIMMMWLSVTLITGIGAVLGTVAFTGEETYGKHLAELTVEGLAAGAMLVMIAETALPEAFRHADKLVGFSTLFGFLAAYAIKLMEEPVYLPPPP